MGSELQNVRWRIKFMRVVYVTIGWTLAGIFLAVYEHVISQTSLYEPTVIYRFSQNVLNNLFMTIFGGFSVAVIEVYYLKEKFSDYSFLNAVILRGFFYVASIWVISSIASCLFNLHLPFFEDNSGNFVQCSLSFLMSFDFLKHVITWSPLAWATLFFLQVSDKYGQGVLWQFLMGKYHHPKEEERIFMFLDLKSSTAIAEKLGHVKYFELLNEFYEDITYAILNHKGEIYQYVGDEIVISWKLKNGLENNNALVVFFEIEEEIRQHREKYLKKYGLVPEFKAGLHFGKVTTGEIGVIKKEIIFTGDVLNTTSRIQNVCNIHKAKLLVSKALYQKFSLNSHRYHVRDMGDVQLRGKSEHVSIVAIEAQHREYAS